MAGRCAVISRLQYLEWLIFRTQRSGSDCELYKLLYSINYKLSSGDPSLMLFVQPQTCISQEGTFAVWHAGTRNSFRRRLSLECEMWSILVVFGFPPLQFSS